MNTQQYDAHVRDLRELQKKVERARRARYRKEQNHADGRPCVDRLSRFGGGKDPLLDVLKEGKR
jgi:hypothetical protein